MKVLRVKNTEIFRAVVNLFRERRKHGFKALAAPLNFAFARSHTWKCSHFYFSLNDFMRVKGKIQRDNYQYARPAMTGGQGAIVPTFKCPIFYGTKV